MTSPTDVDDHHGVVEVESCSDIPVDEAGTVEVGVDAVAMVEDGGDTVDDDCVEDDCCVVVGAGVLAVDMTVVDETPVVLD